MITSMSKPLSLHPHPQNMSPIGVAHGVLFLIKSHVAYSAFLINNLASHYFVFMKTR